MKLKLREIKKKLLRNRYIRFIKWKKCISQNIRLELNRTGGFINSTIILSHSKPQDIDYARQFSKVVNKLKLRENLSFIYPFDISVFREIHPDLTELVSITVDFEKVLNTKLKDIYCVIKSLPDSSFAKAELLTIDSIYILANRISEELRESRNPEIRHLSTLFPDILDRKPESFEEAIQKILFYNGLFWQMNHHHIGLGRLDKILDPYYQSDIASDKLTREKAKDLLVKMCKTLHEDYKYKSASLIGDTGQYILLGGVSQSGVVDNEITRLFLEIFSETAMIDPKLILRVNKFTDDSLWDSAVKSILKGSGSPLLMNENVIMDGMTDFGYDKEDVTEFGTSACWEPLIIGKSSDQNNPFKSISALRPVSDTLQSGIDYKTFKEFWDGYKEKLTKRIANDIPSTLALDCSPLFSLFFDDCISREKDFSQGGAKYAFHGVQVVGLSNAVNALLNIKRWVYNERVLTLNDLKEATDNNFCGWEDIRLLLTGGDTKFGKCSEEVIEMAKSIMDVSSKEVAKLRCNGQPLKIGFSSPSYLILSKYEGATVDGRKAGDPLGVHISPISSDIDIAEVLNFASKLDYSGNRLNGNVVDFILPQSYIKCPNKLRSLLKNAIDEGVYEVQLNVLDKDTLIDAKLHPEKYPDLIVRVWGFSAYFNDLPEEYKDNLINRATIYCEN